MVIEEDFKNSDGFYCVKRNSFITLEEQEYDYSIDRIIIRSSLSSNLEISSRFFKQYIYIYIINNLNETSLRFKVVSA